MSLGLHNLKVAAGSKKHKKRVGRGNASGHGTYSTRGAKGQKARSGSSGMKRLGMRELMHQVPKLGGMSPRYPKMAVVNLETLEKCFKDGDIIDAKILISKNIIKSAKDGLKILGNGKLTKKLTVKANAFSKSAKDAIEKTGGEASAV